MSDSIEAAAVEAIREWAEAESELQAEIRELERVVAQLKCKLASIKGLCEEQT